MSVRHAMLALLSEGPKYGLRLREEFEDRTGEVWPLNVGQVYTTLQRLERDGLVESDGSGEDGPQKAFRITSEGERELAGWLRTPPDLSSPPRDELVMKVLIALRVPGTDPHEVIQAHRRYLVHSCSNGRGSRKTKPTAAWAWRWRSTPSCSGWTRWSGGWTSRMPASSGRKPTPPHPNPDKFERRCHGTGGN